MKAKGQILIFTLIVMAIGLIVISPLLSYLDSSTERYANELVRALAYYNADTMMTGILNDIYSGVNVWVQNISSPYNLLNPPNGSGYLNSGYDVMVRINNSVIAAMPTPEASDDWIYLDPGISTCNTSSCNPDNLLGTLAQNQYHRYQIYLDGGSDVQVNWAAEGSDCGILWTCSPWLCSYHVDVDMSMVDRNGSTVPNTSCSGTSESAPLILHFNWSVPESLSGNYTIIFHNSGCTQRRNLLVFWCYDSESSPALTSFSGAGATDHTWVRVGKQQAGGTVYTYQDYTITATARRNNRDIVSITALIRHDPGASAWWLPQTVEIPSWQITYY